jgi:hypothetical protein
VKKENPHRILAVEKFYSEIYGPEVNKKSRKKEVLYAQVNFLWNFKDRC